MTAIQIEYAQLEGFITALQKHRNGRTHYRLKHKKGEASFVTAQVIDGIVGLKGRITGPHKNHASYLVKIGSAKQVLIKIDLEDPTGVYTIDKAYNDIFASVKQMMKSADKKADFSAGRDTSRLAGFYIKSTGKNRVGVDGKETLALALETKNISKDFHDHCIEVGFTMEHY